MVLRSTLRLLAYLVLADQRRAYRQQYAGSALPRPAAVLPALFSLALGTVIALLLGFFPEPDHDLLMNLLLISSLSATLFLFPSGFQTRSETLFLLSLPIPARQRKAVVLLRALACLFTIGLPLAAPAGVVLKEIHGDPALGLAAPVAFLTGFGAVLGLYGAAFHLPWVAGRRVPVTGLGLGAGFCLLAAAPGLAPGAQLAALARFLCGRQELSPALAGVPLLALLGGVLLYRLSGGAPAPCRARLRPGPPLLSRLAARLCSGGRGWGVAAAALLIHLVRAPRFNFMVTTQLILAWVLVWIPARAHRPEALLAVLAPALLSVSATTFGLCVSRPDACSTPFPRLLGLGTGRLASATLLCSWLLSMAILAPPLLVRALVDRTWIPWSVLVWAAGFVLAAHLMMQLYRPFPLLSFPLGQAGHAALFLGYLLVSLALYSSEAMVLAGATPLAPGIGSLILLQAALVLALQPLASRITPVRLRYWN